MSKSRSRSLSKEKQQLCYQWYFEGMSVTKIVAKLQDDYGISISQGTVYSSIKTYRTLHTEQLGALMRESLKNIADQLSDRLNYHLTELELMAEQYRNQPKLYLEFMDRIIELYKFQMGFTKNEQGKPTAQNDEAGKQAFLDELSKLAAKAKGNTNGSSTN